MNSEIQKWILQARVAMHNGKCRAATQKKHEKNQLERLESEITLILDDLKAEGVDTSTPEGNAIAWYVIGRKYAKHSQAVDSDANFFGRGPLL